jgi:hypothetical protein
MEHARASLIRRVNSAYPKVKQRYGLMLGGGSGFLRHRSAQILF